MLWRTFDSVFFGDLLFVTFVLAIDQCCCRRADGRVTGPAAVDDVDDIGADGFVPALYTAATVIVCVLREF